MELSTLLGQGEINVILERDSLSPFSWEEVVEQIFTIASAHWGFP